MNQQNLGTERGTASAEGGSGGIAAKSHEAAEQLKQTLVDQAEQVRDRAESAKDQAAERIRRVAAELRNVSSSLRSDDTIAANVADRAGRSIEGLASYVSTTDARAFVRDAEELARRQPALFFGSAFLLGLAAGRFLKSSRPEGDLTGGAQRFASGQSDRGQSPQWQQNQQWEGNRVEGIRVEGIRVEGNWPEPTAPRQAWTSERERVGESSNQDRFRANYDAAFGRDVESERHTGSEAASTTSGAPSTPQRTGVKSSESAGGQSGKGTAP